MQEMPAAVGLFDVAESLLHGAKQAIGGEGVSQSPLKDKAFSTFLDQNPLFELQREMRFASDTEAKPGRAMKRR